MNTIKVMNDKIESDLKINKKDNSIYLENQNICIVYENTNLRFNFIIKNQVKLFEYFKNSSVKSNYIVEENSSLVLNRFSLDNSVETKIDLEKNASLIYKYACLNFHDNNYLITINHSQGSHSKIINSGLNMTTSKLDFLINAFIDQKSFNVETDQDSKIILMKDNNSSIKPNLLVNNNDVSATHACYIGHFKNEELFYLKSRGLNDQESLKLLSKAFLVSNMDIDYSCKHMILQALDKSWR